MHAWLAPAPRCIQVLRSEGWHLRLSYKNHQGELKVKPGYVTDTVGSAIVFSVDSSFPGLPALQQQAAQLQRHQVVRMTAMMFGS